MKIVSPLEHRPPQHAPWSCLLDMDAADVALLQEAGRTAAGGLQRGSIETDTVPLARTAGADVYRPRRWRTSR